MRVLPVLFSIALFSAALLSFSIQPILGKMLLPQVGGAPAGWIVAMAFFQIALLTGYGISYVLGRYSPWVHTCGLLALYAAGLFFLPPQLVPLAENAQGAALSAAVIKAMAQTILVPYLALTATTSALQRVFASTSHETAQDPYYLFVASNAGSLIGLFAYPFVLEPLFGLSMQSQGWFILYGVVIALVGFSCLLAWVFRSARHVAQLNGTAETKSTPLTWRQVAFWLVLAFVPCSLSMGVTTLITTDMAGLPLLWVLPLGLYLVTFILAFAKNQLISFERLSRWQLNAIACLLFILVLGPMWGIGFKPTGGVWVYGIFCVLLLEVFFVSAWACHTRLAQLRPAVDKLAFYYFILALGGGLAGLFHAFVLPFVTTDIIEFPVMIVLSLLLIPVATYTKKPLPRLKKWNRIALALAVLSIALVFYQSPTDQSFKYALTVMLFVFSFLFIAHYPRYVFICGIAIMIGSLDARYPGEVVHTGRNFFGSHAVYDNEAHGRVIRYFVHGNTLHGAEPLDKTDVVNRYHSGYYARNNPINDALTIADAKSFGVVGLGVGQLACYDRDVTVDFYEIDPDVETIARTYFTYLEECPPRAIHIGDGLLELVKQPHRYDVLLLDAFTSDGVPMHLLTVDAMAKYKEKLNEKGVLLFHISNRYLNLTHKLAAAARDHGLDAFVKLIEKDPAHPMTLASKWLVIPLQKRDGQIFVSKGWVKAPAADRAWTDDRSSLVEAITVDVRGM